MINSPQLAAYIYYKSPGFSGGDLYIFKYIRYHITLAALLPTYCDKDNVFPSPLFLLCFTSASYAASIAAAFSGLLVL